MTIIDRNIFMPTFCLITEKGEELLDNIRKREPDKIPSEKLLSLISSSFDVKDETTRKEAIERFPLFELVSSSEVGTLADIYLFWAESPPTKELRASPEDLYYAAARGYAKINDFRKFSKAIKGYFTSLSDTGSFLEIAINASDFIKSYPECEDIVIGTVSVVLDKFYWYLTGAPMPGVKDLEGLTSVINEMFALSVDIGQVYAFKLPDQNAVAGFSNRIEDILGEALLTGNRSLFLMVLHLEYHFIELCQSIVEVRDHASHFEQRAGYGDRVSVAERAVVGLEAFEDIVKLDEPHRKTAFQIILAIIRLLHRSVASPIYDMCQAWDSKWEQHTHWTFSLLRFPENILRVEVNVYFKELLQLYEKHRLSEKNDSSLQKLSTELQVDTIDLQSNIIIDIKNSLERLEQKSLSINQNTEVIRYVLIPSIEEQLGQLFVIGLSSQKMLNSVCNEVLRSNVSIQRIDAVLNEKLSDIRHDVAEIIGIVKKSDVISEVDKDSFMNQLEDMLKVSSAAKIIASVPLIPGFVKYQKELVINVDWNKWFRKLIEIFKKE